MDPQAPDEFLQAECVSLVAWVADLEKRNPSIGVIDLAAWILVERYGVPKAMIRSMFRQDVEVFKVPSTVSHSRHLARLDVDASGDPEDIRVDGVNRTARTILANVLKGLTIYVPMELEGDRWTEMTAHLRALFRFLIALYEKIDPRFEIGYVVYLGKILQLDQGTDEDRETFVRRFDSLMQQEDLDPNFSIPLEALRLMVDPDPSPEAWVRLETKLNSLTRPDPLINAMVIEGSQGWRAAHDFLNSVMKNETSIPWSARLRLAEFEMRRGHPRMSERHLTFLRKDRYPACFRGYVEALSRFNRDHWSDTNYPESEIPQRKMFLKGG